MSVVPDNYTIKMITFSVARETAREPGQIASTTLDAVTIARDVIPDDGREHFGVLLLDLKLAVVAYHEVAVGTLDRVVVRVKDVLAPAVRMLGVDGLVLVHNHPTGDPAPSKDDLWLTRRIVAGAKLLDVRIHDHVILGSGTDTFTSFAARGLLKPPKRRRTS